MIQPAEDRTVSRLLSLVICCLAPTDLEWIKKLSLIHLRVCMLGTLIWIHKRWTISTTLNFIHVLRYMSCSSSLLTEGKNSKIMYYLELSLPISILIKTQSQSKDHCETRQAESSQKKEMSSLTQCIKFILIYSNSQSTSQILLIENSKCSQNNVSFQGKKCHPK